MSSAEDAVWNDVIRSEAEYQVSTTGVEASELVDYTKAKKVVFFAGSKHFEFSIEGVPDWIQRMKKGESWFVSVPGLHQSNATYQAVYCKEVPAINYVAGSLFVGFVLGFMVPSLTFAITNDFNINNPEIANSLFNTAGISGLGSAITGGGVGAFVYRRTKAYKNKKPLQIASAALSELNRHGLSDWLQARYNIVANHETVNTLLTTIYHKSDGIKFADVDGKEWMFSRHLSEQGWFVEPVVSAAVREASYVEVTTMVAEKEIGLPIEAAKLWESLQTSIAKLSGESEVEAEHASLRIMEDARSAVQDYRKLVKLGGEVQGESVLVRVLTLLNTEVTGLVEERIERVVSNMEVQSEYLHTRQQHAGLNKNEHVQLPVAPKAEHLMKTRKR